MIARNEVNGSLAASGYPLDDQAVIVSGRDLTIESVVAVARRRVPVAVTQEPEVLRRVEAAYDYVRRAVDAGQPIYGVTTGFGGMANVVIDRELAADFQNNAIWLHKTGAGKRLPTADVRATMLLRMNSHLRGTAGVRLELVQRIAHFLNANVTPHVHEFGSIGASGDLVPLTYITGALIGLDQCFGVDFDGEELDAPAALARLGLPRLRLQPKEGLAMINGTAAMSGIATNCLFDAQTLLGLTLGVHALMFQGLCGTNQSFHPFIQEQKPHPGQRWVAEQMLQLLAESRLIRDELDGRHDHRGHDLIQDRYSLRCLPQYLGPIVEGVAQIRRQLEIEINSANDNPLIDPDRQVSYHGGNFLGQYIGIGMDQLRYYIGLLAKHLDVQIALLVTPEFSNGLPPSLIGNMARPINMGLKGLQLSGNSIMPLLGFLGNSLADRFPTHAEQFNQNINSQGFGSANLARQALDTFRHYLAIALIFGLQAVDLRTYLLAGHYHAPACLSPATRLLYDTCRNVLERPAQADRPLIRDDNEQALDQFIARLVADIAADGAIPQALRTLVAPAL